MQHTGRRYIYRSSSSQTKATTPTTQKHSTDQHRTSDKSLAFSNKAQNTKRRSRHTRQNQHQDNKSNSIHITSKLHNLQTHKARLLFKRTHTFKTTTGFSLFCRCLRRAIKEREGARSARFAVVVAGSRKSFYYV